MPPDFHSPPQFLRRIIHGLLPETDRNTLSGDFDQMFNLLYNEKGPVAAKRWYRLQLLQSLPHILLNSFRWRFAMLVSFLKISLRHLRQQKAYSIINISGLSVGMAFFLLILLLVRHELSFDNFHKGSTDIYRLCAIRGNQDRPNRHSAAVSPAVAEALVREFPEIIQAARLFIPFSSHTVRSKEQVFVENRFFYADSQLLKILNFNFIKGAKNSLTRPNTLILTTATAAKYFPSNNALGKVLTVFDGQKDQDYEVGAVIEDPPSNSHLRFDILASFQNHELSQVNNWFLMAVFTYLRLQPDTTAATLESKFPESILRNAGAQFGEDYSFDDWLADGNQFDFFLQPLRDIHLYSQNLGPRLENAGDIRYVHLYSAISLIILMIAGFNFINLSTARSATRAHEVGVRKVLGSSKTMILRQFLTESACLSLMAFFPAMGLIYLLYPLLTNLAGRPIPIGHLIQPEILPLFLLGAFVVGITAGIYPAFYLSAFSPIRILRGSFKSIKQQSRLRSSLVIFQFALSLVLLIGTWVVYSQLRFMDNQDLGFDGESVITTSTHPDLLERFPAFKSDLMFYPEIGNVSLSDSLPGSAFIGEEFFPVDTNPGQFPSKAALALMHSDPSLLSTLCLQLESGRFISSDSPEDSMVINRTAAKKLKDLFGWDNPLGQRITTGRRAYGIIGIIKDFHIHSLHRPMTPLGLMPLPQGNGRYLSIRLKTPDPTAALIRIKERWQKFFPEQPFLYTFLDSDYKRPYQKDQRTGKMLGLFSMLAAFIGSLGLFGLATYTAERRTKEIGIRKVLGASGSRIGFMLLGGFSRQVLLANLFAWPAAFFIMRHWLQNFAYRTALTPAMFLLPGLIILGIACLAVGVQAVRSAVANPVNVLRHE